MIPRTTTLDSTNGVLMASSHSGFESHHLHAGNPHCPHSYARPPLYNGQSAGNGSTNDSNLSTQPWARKYVILCFLCGGLAVLLGVILMGIYFTLRSFTSSMHYFETIPTYVPAVVLIITGLLIMCFSKRRNRYSYLIKLTGACLLICTLLCIVITVSTTVIHMSRLQTLRECVYAQKAKTCTCFSGSGPTPMNDNGNRFVFNNTPHCEAIHGSLYSCLRALFGLSVVGILICIFSSMLVYQLLTHERKKSYWEQMELRRRFFYRRHPHYPYCGCYDEIYPWYPWEVMEDSLFRASPTNRQSQLISDTGSRPSTSGVRQTSLSRQTSILRWLPWPWRCSNEIASGSHSDNGTQTFSVREARLRDRQGPSPDPRFRERFNISSARNIRTTRRIEDRCQASTIGTIQQVPNPSAALQNRRRRPNDAVTQHLNLVNRYQHFLVANQRGRGVYSSTQIGEFSIPRHMWGPPPPYPHSPTIEQFNNQNPGTRRVRNSIEHCQRSTEDHVEDGIQVSAPLLDMVQSIESTETFSIVDETKRHTSDVDLNGGEIHILTVDVHPTHEYIAEDPEDKEDHDRSCLVEIHVPYVDDINKKDEMKNVSSFTLPLRQSRKLADITPFKSLSNIPMYLSQKLSNLNQQSEDNCTLDETNIDLLEESLMQKLCQFSDDSVITDGRYVFDDTALSSLCNSSNESPISDHIPSSPEFSPTIVELFTDYKSRIVIATTPCTPVHDDIPLSDVVCMTRSMPNLYCSICTDSGPITTTNSCCSGSASSMGCSTASLPDDIFNVEESTPHASNRPNRTCSNEDLTRCYDSASDKDDQNGNLVPEYSVDYLISITSSASAQPRPNTNRRRRKRSRAVIIRQNAVNESSSSSDYNESVVDGLMWPEENAQNTRGVGGRQSRRRAFISNQSSDSCDTISEGSNFNVRFISVNQS